MPEVAVVIGAGRGIGRATARMLSRQGYRVLAGARTAADLDSLQAAVDRDECAHPLSCATVDVRSPASVEKFFEVAAQIDDGIDVLVISSGAAGLGGVGSAPDEMAEMAMTNLVGPFHCMHFAQRLLAAREGMAVILVSRAARACYPQTLAYGATKAGLVYLVQAMARELAAQRIAVVGFSPGAVATPMRRALYPLEDPSSILQAEDAAAAIMALLHPQLRRATGSIVDFPW